MKIIMKPIEMIAWFTDNDIPKPLRYRISTKEGSKQVIRIEKIISVEEEKLAGNKMFVYTCQSTIRNQTRVFELKYELSTCKWYLSKM
ncbi:hypothetical protein [Natranaerobius trueperi]|uniref:Uncharacterized protein n=1 Tax=Natranaerobius trueperi TaxID=759412 RepID=A0A226C221_9FIRM|nr:hypothetical protein [Natranaerobius trueperi]OWZ84430.1 hypothetical protein CDO51_02690 [Natranaerobius trueperi]